MRVLYFHNYPYKSEKANLIQVKAMCQAIVNNGGEARLVLPGDFTDFIKTGEFDISVRRKIISFKLDRFLSPFSLRTAVRRYEPDVVFLRDPIYLVWIYLFTKYKVIFESHDACLHKGSRFLNYILKFMILRISDSDRLLRFVCISHALGDFWKEKGICNNKLIVAHDGVDLKGFGSLQDKHTAREIIGLQNDAIVASYVGRVYPNRKLETIIEVASRFNDIIFIIVGGPDTAASELEVLSRSKGIDNVKIVGQVNHDDVPTYLAASDILLGLWSDEVSTINYCSPLKIFEYMASRRLIVAHDFPTIKEVLVDGKDAILFRYGNLDDFEAALKRSLLCLDGGRIQQSAYDKVSQFYTWDLRIVSIFKRLL